MNRDKNTIAPLPDRRRFPTNAVVEPAAYAKGPNGLLANNDAGTTFHHRWVAGARAEAHMADNVSLARGLYEAFNTRDFDNLADYLTPDAKITIVGSGDTYDGAEGARSYNVMWADGFPDGQITIDNVIAAGDYVVVEFTGRGTQTGTLATPAGSIPATGRAVTLKLCDVLEIRDGKVSRQRTYFDGASLLSQLGVTAEQLATTKK